MGGVLDDSLHRCPSAGRLLSETVGVQEKDEAAAQHQESNPQKAAKISPFSKPSPTSSAAQPPEKIKPLSSFNMAGGSPLC